MAAGTPGSLEEFFDFERLEADMSNGLRAACQQEEMVAEACPVPELDSVMDWEQTTFDAPVTLAALPSQSLQESLQYTAPAQNWAVPPNFPIPYQGSSCHPIPSYSDAPISAGDIPPLELQSNTVYPSSDIVSRGSISTIASPTEEIKGNFLLRNEQPLLHPRPSASTNHKPASAKRKGPSARIPIEARQMLEEEFSANPYPVGWEIDIIAHQANLDAKRVRNWFNNARARKRPSGNEESPEENPNGSSPSLSTKLSAESLEALSKQVDEGVSAPQPPLAVYLASSYLEEAAEFSDIQAAMETYPPSDRGDTFMDSSSGSRIGKTGSVITSLTSSDGSAPTSFTLSSAGSSSFGRDRRRGRRRMTWRASPYNKARVDSMNDAGQPARNLPFFCTFCPRAFKTKYEWVRHEDSVHALRTTWICCSTKQDPQLMCLFCGHERPDEVHMATHKYQQCRNKPEMHRTFYRRDHFVQHLHHVHFANVKHPSPRYGCGGRTPAAETRDYGCKYLAMRWRRFGAPMRADDPMLHCGFCGKTSRDWNARCDHVAEHLVSGGYDRSAWWSDREENHLENLCSPQTSGPFRCRYCQKVFANQEAMNNHSHCRVWSCRFLRTFDDVGSENSGPPLCPQFPSPKAHHCHLCGAGHRSSHIEHAQQYHKYRQCNQNLYTSEIDFLQHLHDFHGASHPLLLQHNPVLEQHFSRNKGACFEPVDFDEILQGCREATPTASFVDPFPIGKGKSTVSLAPTEESVDRSDVSSTSPRRKTRDRLSDEADTSAKLRGQTKPEPHGPRFFRLDPLVPFLSTRIYYLRNAKMSNLFHDGRALLEEMPKSHIASLVMSSGLVGMAGARLPVQTNKDNVGVVEFTLDDAED